MFRLLIISFLLLHAVSANAQRATATLDRTTVAAGERVELSISCENFQPFKVPSVPSIPGLLISNSGSARSFQLVGGQQISTLIYNFIITANKTGTYSIPGVSIQSNSGLFKTQPLKLRVVAADSPNNKSQLSNYAFVRLIPSKDKAYIGEPIRIEVQLFLTNGSPPIKPKLSAEGFNLTDFVRPRQLKSTLQKGNNFYTGIIYETVATPIKTGNLKIGPAKMDVTLRITQNQRQRSRFNDPFAGLINRYREVPVKLESKSQNITVKPLPSEGKPTNFNGTVGQYSMTAKASPLEVTVGDPVTINIELSGTGTIESLNFPKPEWTDFKSYEPTILSKKTDPLGLTGLKAFEQVIIPENETIKEIPSLKIAYFDPKDESYKVLSQGPFALKVNPSSKPSSVQNTSISETDSSELENEKPQLSDILWIKYEAGTLGNSTPFVLRPAFWLLQSIPLLFLIGTLILRHKRNLFANNPKLRRQLQVEQITSKTLTKLAILIEENKALEFHIELATVLREQLGLKLDIPSEGITCDSIDEPLAKKNIKPETREILRKLFTSCDAASYAASQSTAELHEYINDLEKFISDLK